MVLTVKGCGVGNTCTGCGIGTAVVLGGLLEVPKTATGRAGPAMVPAWVEIGGGCEGFKAVHRMILWSYVGLVAGNFVSRINRGW